MNRRRLAIVAVIEGVLSSLDSRKSPRKIIDALVQDHGAQCRWSKGRWTFRLLGVSVQGRACNRALLERWRDAALRVATSTTLSDVAPLYRPGFVINLLYRALNPTTLLVEAATRIEEWIERYLEAHHDISCVQCRRPAPQRLLHWLIEDPETAREAKELGDRRDATSSTARDVSPVSRTESARPLQRPAYAHSAKGATDCSLRLLPEPGCDPRPSANRAAQLRLIETSPHNSSAPFASPSIESADVSSDVAPDGGAA